MKFLDKLRNAIPDNPNPKLMLTSYLKKMMKDRIKSMKDRLHDERAAIFVESAIVFPVMFFVLLFIMYIGNLYYVQARIDSLTQSYAIRGAEYAANPYQENIDKGEPVPTDINKLDIEPYRYILGPISKGKIGSIEDSLSKALKEDMNKDNLFLFNGQKITNITTDNKNKLCEWHNYVVYSSFVVQVNYEIKFPIRFLMEKEPVIARLSSRSEVSVNDAPEFIRNLDMTADLLDGSSTMKTIKSIFKKIQSFIDKVS